jgi:galactose mutarotase-like enzyme
MILDQVRSRRVRFGTATGRQIEVSFPDAPYLGLWNKPGAPFVCIEPWQGIADPQGFSGELTEKPGIFMVAPGASHQLQIQIELTR